MKLESAEMANLGRARKVIATKDATTIVEGAGDRAKVHARTGQIKTLIEQSTSDFEKEKLQERLAKLSGGVAVLKVGAASEVEMKEKKHRIEDAVAATKAAIEEGIVPGGGVALIRVQEGLNMLRSELESSNKVEAMGVDIVAKALEAPLRQIANNAGEKGDVVVQRIKSQTGTYGYNALLGKDEHDMVAAGIIDPAKVTRSAVENATSIAIMIITTEAAITDLPKKDSAPAPGGMPGGMPGMGMM